LVKKFRDNMNIIAIILTHNSETTIAKVINSARLVASRILIIDDQSKDKTIEIAKSLGCEIKKHKFINYSKQRNWAQEYANLKSSDWVLHIDADEIITKELANNIIKTLKKSTVGAYLIKKRFYFLGKPISFGYINPSWHLRLFKKKNGLCEERNYDQHFVTKGKTKKITGLLLDLQSHSLKQWITSHKKWAQAEAIEVVSKTKKKNTLKPSLKGDKRMQKRWMKLNLYYKFPPFLRAFLFYLYSYVFCLGFLDGLPGLRYHFLHTFWFRTLVDINILKLKKTK